LALFLVHDELDSCESIDLPAFPNTGQHNLSFYAISPARDKRETLSMPPFKRVLHRRS